MRDAWQVIDSFAAPAVTWPAEKRALAGRPTLPVVYGGEATVLRWSNLSPAALSPAAGGGEFRITAVVDHRHPHRIAATNAASGEAMGTIDVLFSTAGEVFPLSLTGPQVAAAARDGIALRLVDDLPPLWLTAPGESVHPAIAPNLMTPQWLESDGTSGKLDAFLSLFCSTASLQPCDWMEACVLDGLNDRARAGRDDAAAALRDHLDVFFPVGGAFRHEDIVGGPIDDQPCGQENHGPIAVAAMHRPDHRALRITAEAFDRQHTRADGTATQERVVAETSYSMAYVMMSMAVHAGFDALRQRALAQLRGNRDRLAEADDLWLRWNPATGERTFGNWSRGVAWYFLGLVRTLSLLECEQRPADLVDEVRRVAAWVIHHQDQRGLWSVYLKEEGLSPDTSGSAGIAAALAIAHRHEMIAASSAEAPAAEAAARRALVGLVNYLTPDGWLTGVSQSNKSQTHAMDIQRSSYRVIGPWGMGMLAQLCAALGEGR